MSQNIILADDGRARKPSPSLSLFHNRKRKGQTERGRSKGNCCRHFFFQVLDKTSVRQRRWILSSGCPVISGFSSLCVRSPGMGRVPRCLCWAWALILWKEDNIHSLLFNTVECLRQNIILLILFAEVGHVNHILDQSFVFKHWVQDLTFIFVICVYGFFVFFLFWTRFSDFPNNLHFLIELQVLVFSG